MAEKQYVVFDINGQEFAIDINRVKTIEKITPVTRVPGAQDFIIGVINLRGEVIPVVDMRKRMDMEPREFDDESRIIIVTVNEMEVGMTADSATEVINIEDEHIDNNLDFTRNIEHSFVEGVGKADNRIVVILNLEKILRID
jgi:purine-binding chemotaxis protein CheW